MLVHAMGHQGKVAHGHLSKLPWGPHVTGLHEVALWPHLHGPELRLLRCLPMPRNALIRVGALPQMRWQLWELHHTNSPFRSSRMSEIS